MDIFTHALAPVLIAHHAAGNRKPFSKRDLLLIGLAGAMPDLLNPHLSLEARMHSWSHGMPFWLAISVLLFGLCRVRKLRISLRLALGLSLSYLLHIVCDAISGGIDWLYPFGNFVWGEYWVDPILWVPLDIILLLVAYFQFRVLPMRRKVAAAKRSKQRS